VSPSAPHVLHRNFIMQIHHNELVQIVLIYEGVSKSFRTGRLERELQIVQLSATRCSKDKAVPVLN
jgi:hypothetical protein